MQNKTALIVDDSRTASQMLRLMLEREEFQVDVIGNAEAAVGYLRDHRPGIIFMDHLMPGMDGFQAVKEIKNNTLAADIPIVMYTAKSGDLYVGQAQALGAVDILPKPPTRELLRAVFRRLDDRANPANEPFDAPLSPEPSGETSIAGTLSDAPDATAEGVGTRAVVAPPVPLPGNDFLRDVAEQDGGAAGRRVSWLLTLVVAAAAFAVGTQFTSRPAGPGAWADALGWALSESLTYPYGEVPFGGPRTALVQGLVERLSKAGFRGTLRLEGHAGQFCLLASQGGWKVADAGTPLDSCDVKGFFSKQDARTASARQTPEFRAMLEGVAASAPGIRVVVDGVGDDKRHADYPTPDSVRDAGAWNRVAADNNRIGVSLVPDS
jgi:CheY-like chemotaxis protein